MVVAGVLALYLVIWLNGNAYINLHKAEYLIAPVKPQLKYLKLWDNRLARDMFIAFIGCEYCIRCFHLAHSGFCGEDNYIAQDT